MRFALLTTADRCITNWMEAYRTAEVGHVRRLFHLGAVPIIGWQREAVHRSHDVGAGCAVVRVKTSTRGRT